MIRSFLKTVTEAVRPSRPPDDTVTGSDGPHADDAVSISTLDEVKREIAARDFDRAEVLLEDALAGDPSSPALHKQRGLLAEAKGDVTAALTALRAAVTLAPHDAELRLAELRVAANSDRRDLMGEIAVAAVAAVPDDDRVLRLAAKALTKKRDYARAGAYWRRLGERAGDVAAIVEGARILVAARDFSGALDCAEEALRRDPASLPAKIQKARAIERAAPESAAFAQAVLDIAADDAWEALEYLPYLLCYDLHETLVRLIEACRRQDVRIEAPLVPPVVRVVEAFAGRLDDEASSAAVARAGAAIAYLETCRRTGPAAGPSAAPEDAVVELGD